MRAPVLNWYCDANHPENNAKPLCLRKRASEAKAEGKPAGVLTDVKAPTITDSLAAVRAFCTSKAGAGASLCLGAKLGRTSTSGSTAQASVKPAAGAKAHVPGAKKSGMKKAGGKKVGAAPGAAAAA